MSEQRRQDWSLDGFLEWEARQPLRHELVDGQPRAMVGGTLAHDVIGNNLRAALRSALRGRPCRTHGPDVKIATGNGNIRYPDALVDCGRFVPNARLAQQPVAVFEVLSASTAFVDQYVKLRDHEATPGTSHYVLINQDERRAVHYTRDAFGRFGTQAAMLLEGDDAVIGIAELGISIPLASLHEGLEETP